VGILQEEVEELANLAGIDHLVGASQEISRKMTKATESNILLRARDPEACAGCAGCYHLVLSWIGCSSGRRQGFWLNEKVAS